MIIFKSAKELSFYLQNAKTHSLTIGFVPTMGALHEGHLSLIRQSKKHTQLTVGSIFINPTQFNNQDDFKKYPVAIEKDIEQLIESGCDVLFLPPVQEIYPEGYGPPYYELGDLETILEGAYRPGHFQGVCQVMDRLLQIVTPDHLFMGQKDFQQCMVITKLLSLQAQLNTIQLHIEPTRREADGVAMSSRNLRLTPCQRNAAIAISKSLFFIKENFKTMPVDVLKKEAFIQLKNAGFVTDYVAICNMQTLMPVANADQPAVALIAATIGNVRLIDNLLLD